MIPVWLFYRWWTLGYLVGWSYRHAARAEEQEARYIGPYGRLEIVRRKAR